VEDVLTNCDSARVELLGVGLESGQLVFDAGRPGVDFAQLRLQLGEDLVGVSGEGRQLPDGIAEGAVVDRHQLAVVLEQEAVVPGRPGRVRRRPTHQPRTDHSLHERHPRSHIVPLSQG